MDAVRWAAWMILGCVGFAPAAEPLVYKFKPGQVLNYQAEITAIVLTPDGVTVAVDSKQIFDFANTVTLVDRDGSATISRKIKRVRLKTTAGNVRLDFDSNFPKAGEGDPGELVTETIKVLIAGDMSYKMSPAGTMSEFKLSKAIEQFYRDNPKASSVGLGESNLKDVASQTALNLPGNSFSVGTKWAKTDESDQQIFNQKIVTEYTYEGPGKEPGIERIVAHPRMTMLAKPNVPMPLKLKSQVHDVDIAFDRERGQVVGFEGENKLTMEFTADGQTGIQNYTVKTVIRLLPGP